MLSILPLPILWRYLLQNYFKVLCFSVISFIAVLLTTRLDDIAKFASLTPSGSFIWYYTFYQIPYILPIAIPISSLISAIILFQNLSDSHELTAMRACGFSFKEICCPILLASLLVAGANFYIASELATASHLITKQMEQSLKAVNPLLLLQSKNLLRYKGIWSDVQGSLQGGEKGSKILIALRNEASSRLSLIGFNHLEKQQEGLYGQDAFIITSIPAQENSHFDHTFVENIAQMSFPTDGLMLSLTNSGWRLSNDHLSLALLKVRLEEALKDLPKAKDAAKERLEKVCSSCFSELFRRLSIALAPITFTLMGIAFGINISRRPSKKGILTVISLTALYLICFFIAKEVDKQWELAASIYLAPHLLIALLSARSLKLANRGIET